jgi:hypothetical protein
MTKVHPNVAAAAAVAASLAAAAAEEEKKGQAVSLTVWRRSLLFNGKGFTVFDSNGDLVFRVETYAGGSPREVVLMDADGRALLTIRRKVPLFLFLICSMFLGLTLVFPFLEENFLVLIRRWLRDLGILQKLSLADEWLIYDGDAAASSSAPADWRRPRGPSARRRG